MVMRMDDLLRDSVCIQILVAGLKLHDNTEPTCMGERCSNYLICLDSVLTAKHHIAELKKKERRNA